MLVEGVLDLVQLGGFVAEFVHLREDFTLGGDLLYPGALVTGERGPQGLVPGDQHAHRVGDAVEAGARRDIREATVHIGPLAVLEGDPRKHVALPERGGPAAGGAGADGDGQAVCGHRLGHGSKLGPPPWGSIGGIPGFGPRPWTPPRRNGQDASGQRRTGWRGNGCPRWSPDCSAR